MNDFSRVGSSLFPSVAPKELSDLLSNLPQLTLPANTVLFREGDQGDTLFIILEGELDIIKAIGTPEERLLITKYPGEYFGEMSLLDPNQLRTASVVSRTDARLLVMSRGEFESSLRRWPGIAYDLAQLLCFRLRDTNDATIRDLKEKNRKLEKAYRKLKKAQKHLIEKEKLDRELMLAWEIQHSMLPRSLPSLSGFDFGARIVPARIVGGDFYDFIVLDENTVGIAIGDVAGKGMPAAIFMAMTRSLIRATAKQVVSPRKVLQTVNDSLLEMNDAQMFVTILYGVLDRRSYRWDYGRAGHELPLLCKEGKIMAPVPFCPGQPLGILTDPDIDVQTLELSPGDTLLLFTDGATEAVDEQGVPLGLQGLKDALSDLCSLSAQDLCEALIERVMEYQHQVPQHDDVTIVAVQACAKGRGRPEAETNRLSVGNGIV